MHVLYYVIQVSFHALMRIQDIELTILKFGGNKSGRISTKYMLQLMSNLIWSSKTVWRYETPCITQNTILNTSCTFPDKTRIACAMSVFLRRIGKQIEKILWQITCIQILWEVVIPDIQSNLPKFLKILPQHIVCFEKPWK